MFHLWEMKICFVSTNLFVLYGCYKHVKTQKKVIKMGAFTKITFFYPLPPPPYFQNKLKIRGVCMFIIMFV